WYWAQTRDKASHSPIPIPLGYRGHVTCLERKQLKLEHAEDGLGDFSLKDGPRPGRPWDTSDKMLRSIFDVKDAPRKGKPVVENVDKITEIIEVDRLIEFPSAKPWPNGMKSTHFLNGWCLGMRNGSHTTILCESDHGQSALRQLKRWQTRTNGQEGSTVHLVGLERNHLLGDASAWPNTKFRSLLSTTGPFEASD
ncbi:hypothetical protein TNCV_3607761, partial [Trichonephila clavipes]